MNARASRERGLLVGTIVSGLLVVLSHGGPIACSTTAQQVEWRTVRPPLEPGQQRELVLTRETSRAATAAATQPEVAGPIPGVGAARARIARGELVELQRHPGAPGKPVSQGAFAAFDPARQTVLITPSDSESIEAVPFEQIQTLTVLGESRRGAHAGNGALIGGLSGLVIGGLVGASVGGSNYGALCAAVVGVPSAGVGALVGGGVGTALPDGRARTEFPLEPGGWQIGASHTFVLGSPPQPGAGREAP